MSVALKELRILLRSGRAFACFVAVLGIVSLVYVIFWVSEMGGVVSPNDRATFARTTFGMISLTQLFLFAILTPAITATSVTSERERRTLPLLLASGYRPHQIVLGKWFSAIAFQCILAVGLLPVVGLVFSLGGVGLDEFLLSFLLILLTVGSYGMVGLAVSTICRTSAVALFATLLALGLLSLLVMGVMAGSFRLTGSGAELTSALVPQLFLHGMIWFMMFVSAVSNLVDRSEPPRRDRPENLIHDEQVLQQRRERFPYYLIDPLARPQAIADHQNPVWVKEQRVSFLANPVTVLRSLLPCVILSLLIMFPVGLDYNNPYDRFGAWSHWTIGIILLLTPALAAGMLSKEREEDTLELLIATPLPVRGIVLAKYFVVLRFVGVMIFGLMLLPCLVHFTGEGSSLRSFHALIANLPPLLAFAALYAAVALACSAACRRTFMAIVLAFVILAAMSQMPAILDFGRDLFDVNSESQIFWFLGSFVAPLISPFYPFLGGGNPSTGAWNERHQVWNARAYDNLMYNPQLSAVWGLIQAFLIVLLTIRILRWVERRLAQEVARK